MEQYKSRIRDLREDMDLRQVDVAKATGIDQKTLSNYETGKTNPDSIALVRLADCFHVSIDYLLGRSDISISNKKDIVQKIEKIEELLKTLKKDL